MGNSGKLKPDSGSDSRQKPEGGQVIDANGNVIEEASDTEREEAYVEDIKVISILVDIHHQRILI